MITGIHGIVEARKNDQAVIRVGGFSVKVFAPAPTLNRLPEPGNEVSLHTHFYMREDGIALYGFTSESDCALFEQLIGISGVGPKVGLALLSFLDAQTFYQAIADEDVQRLCLAPGVGKKLAARLILELKGKLPQTLPGGAPLPQVSSSLQTQVLEALIGLGFSQVEAQNALSKLPNDQNLSLEQQVTLALRSFSRS